MQILPVSLLINPQKRQNKREFTLFKKNYISNFNWVTFTLTGYLILIMIIEEKSYNQRIEHSKKAGFTHIFRRKGVVNLKQTPEESITNMKDVLNRIRSRYGPRNGIGEIIVSTQENENHEQVQIRTIKPHTYHEVYESSYNLGRSLFGRTLYFQENLYNMKFIGIYSKNRYQWFIADWACIHFGLTSVPLYDTLGIENLSYCLDQTEMTTLFVDRNSIKTLLTLEEIGNLKNIICFDIIDEEIASQLKAKKLRCFSYLQLIEEGKLLTNLNNDQINVQKNDCYTFSYTSGTTGPPKGAMISHKNMLACTCTFLENNDVSFENADDRYLSYLPLPHLLQRAISLLMMYSGAFVVVSSGNNLKLREDCLIVKPTIFLSVPRIYNRIADGIKSKFEKQTGIKKCLIDKAVNSKMSTAKQTGQFTHCIYDSLVFSHVKESFGGCIRMLATGSAPINPEVQAFLKIAMACPIIEGYGQTQSSGLALVNRALDTRYGTLSQISCSLEVKLADIPQMRYTAQDVDEEGKPSPRGEVWVRGPQVFMGYYKLPEITKEAVTEEGWLKTGDIAQFFPENKSFKIIDRKKNIFKLQQGEYLAPDRIQNIYLKSKLITEIFLHGDSQKNYAVAIATPNPEELQLLADHKGIKGSHEEFCANKEIKKLILTQLNDIGRKGGLNGFELAKNIFLEPTSFLSQKLLTNTLKIIRFEARNHYKSEINKLYEEGQLSLK